VENQDLERKRARGTHFLKSADRGADLNIKAKQACEGYLPTREHKGRDKSGHR
jgi:hypothetical protein